MSRFETRTLKLSMMVLAFSGLAANAGQDRPSTPSAADAIAVNPKAADCYGGAGCLDESFGAKGKVRLDVGGTSQVATAIAVQPSDGKSIVVGYSNVRANPFVSNWIIARFNRDGTVDHGFGADGVVKWRCFDQPEHAMVVVAASQQARAVAVQADGKILVSGWCFSGTINRSVVLRFGPSGVLDAGFGTGGEVIVDFGGYTPVARALKVQPDGKILMGATSAGEFSASIVRLNANGALDTSFGSNGFRLVSSGSANIRVGVGTLTLALQSTGDIVIGGAHGPDFGLWRLTPTGALDPTFGRSGLTTVDFLGQADAPSSIAVGADDSLVVAGSAQSAATATSANMALAKFSADGRPVTSFGNGGKVMLDMHGGDDTARGVAFQPDGKIIFGGRSTLPDSSNVFFVVGRLTASGALDPSFGIGGVTETDMGIKASAQTMVVDANNLITVAGYSSQTPASNPTMWLLARYRR